MIGPAISVIMSVYNGEAHLAEAVESVLSQTFRDFELVILDDGSTDRSLEIVRGYAAKDSRVRLITRENRGLIASLNQLIDEAKAPLLARMDADDRCHPERLAKQQAFLAAHPACGVVGSWAHRMGGDGKVRPGSGYKYPVTPAEVRAAIGYESILAHPAVMYRREVVHQAGGYHPAFKHVEDFELWLRMADITEISNIPEFLLSYRTHGDQITDRHLLEQRINIGISLHARKIRQGGRLDPTAGVGRLPSMGEIDAFFGQAGIERDILDRVVPAILFSKRTLMNGGIAAIRGYLELGGDRAGIWRAVVRLAINFGEWKAAAALASVLLKTGRASRPKVNADKAQQPLPIP